jgi:hypothetical protein
MMAAKISFHTENGVVENLKISAARRSFRHGGQGATLPHLY